MCERACGRRGGATPRTWLVVAVLAALIGAAGVGAASPATAQAGIKGKAKKKTKKRIQKLDARPVKISCKRTKKDGVKCKWTYAKLLGSSTVRNCKGESQLKRKRGRLRFRQRGCKGDRGAGAVIELLPAKLLQEGYEATSVFCFTTLGSGYNCVWEGLSFKPSAIEDCSGTATSRDRTVTINPAGCTPNAELTASQASVKSELTSSGLTPGQINCRPGSPIECTYEASTASGGWRYSCSGSASGPNALGRFSVERCDLSAPAEAPLTPTPGPHPTFGVNEGWTLYPGQLRMLRDDFGAQTARFSVNWAAVEESPTAGYDWSQPDSVYSAITARGLKPIIILGAAPCWATDDPCSAGQYNHPPSLSNLPAWQDFVREAARRYPEALAFEIWNEANSGLFFHGAPRPARYARVLERAYDAVKSVDPKLPVITTGLAPYATSAPGAWRYDDFLRDLYREGIKGHYDAIAHHGYTGRWPDEDYEQSIRIQLAALKDVMLDYGEQDTDIWITETGVSNNGSKPFSEAEQAEAITKLYRQYRRIPGVPVVVAHRWRDDGTAGGALAAEAGYGLQRENGSLKPAYCALSAVRPAPNATSC